MFNFLFYQDSLISFILTAIRVGAIIFAAPFFGSNVIKAQIKVFLAILIALIIFPSLKIVHFGNLPLLELVFIIFKEILIGVCIGMLSHFLFVGVQLGGQIAGMQMGFGIVNVIDPSSNVSLSIIASFLNIAMLLLFIALGGHYLVIGAIAESFRFIPLGAVHINPLTFEYMAKLFGFIFLTAVKIMAPVLITLLILETVMGVIGKFVPQINLMIVGFPLKIAAGLIMLALSMNYFYIVYEKLLHRYFEEVANLIRLF